MPVLLDTSRLDPGDRAAALESVLTAATAAHDLRLLGPTSTIYARLEHWQLNPDVALLHQASSGVSHTRTERHAHRDGPERVVFVLHAGGPGSYGHDGTTYRLHHGGLYVTDLNSCYSYTRPGQGAARIVQIERSALGLTTEQVQSASARLWASPFYNLLRSHIAELCQLAPTLNASDSATLAPITAHLAGTLLRTAIATDDPRDQSHDYLIDRTVLFMRANFHRPELTAAEIAHEHGVSTRHLFQRWSRQPETLAQTLRDIRLASARELLTTQPPLPIEIIAHRCGFANASHFSRRFRATFGISPRQHRHAASDNKPGATEGPGCNHPGPFASAIEAARGSC